MRRGTLGESGSDDSTMHHFYDRRRPIRNPYEQASTFGHGAKQPLSYGLRSSSTNTDEQPSTSKGTKSNHTTSKKVTGAARRKMSYRQRELKLLKSIAKMQNTTNLQIPKAAFARVVREISMQINPEIQRYSLTALAALHEATEMFMTQLFQDSYMLTMHRKCVTLSCADMMLIRSLKLNF